MRNLLLPAALAVLLPASTAFAQTAWVEVDDQVMVAPFNLNADRVDDMDVVDAAGRKIGEIEDVIGPSRTEATALVVDFESGSGYVAGDDDVIVPLAGFELQGENLLLLGDAQTVRGYEIYRD
jgi:hypothetical protein